MRIDDCTLSQGGDDGLDKEHLLSPSDDNTQDIPAEVLPRGCMISLQWIGMVVIVLLFINASCSLVTMWKLQLASRLLKQFLNFADNRDLRRPDPYDGL